MAYLQFHQEPLGAVPYKQTNGNDVIGNGKQNEKPVSAGTEERPRKSTSNGSGRPDGIVLAEAVVKGEVTAVRQLLRSGVDVNAVNEVSVAIWRILRQHVRG